MLGPHVVERERATDGAHDGATEGFERVRHERCVKRDAVRCSLAAAQPVVHSVCSARESDYNRMHAYMHVYILKLQE